VIQVDFPYHVDPLGRTAATTDGDHVRDLIEQVLFTAPGERVNRPTFGSGLLELVFAPSSDALVAATEMTVQAALQEWLADVVDVQRVDVVASESTISVTVSYVVRATQTPSVATFTETLP
jgi:phage baseplate assembly protein W